MMKSQTKRKSILARLDFKHHWQKHLMLLPMLILYFIFHYVPMTGIVMAFQDYLPSKGYFGSPWAGLKWFQYMFSMDKFIAVIGNTLFISLLKLLGGLAASVVFALLLNELRRKRMSSAIQSMVLFPYFVSWVIIANLLKDIVSIDGVLNQGIAGIFGESIPFLTNGKWFVVLLVISSIWKGVGYDAIILMAAIATIDPALYEAAVIDGAGRWQKMRYITFPSIAPTIAMLLILALGGVLNAGFDQVYNLYNTSVISSSDIIDTYVFRMGINKGLYSLGTAIGLFKSFVGTILVVLSYKAADKFAGYRIF